MLSCTRWLKVGYFLSLATALVLLLSKPAPIQAQRTLAYPFLPGALTNALQMSILAGFSGPMNSYSAATQMIAQAGIPVGLAIGGGQPTGAIGGIGGIGGGMGGMGGGMSGGMMGMGGGMAGMGGMGGMAGMGGMNMGGMGGGGMGGMGGFAGKGFGGFNGKKPL